MLSYASYPEHVGRFCSALYGNLTAVIFTTVVALVLWSLFCYISSPLRKFPGPFLAGFTNIWRFVLVVRGEYATTIKKLHGKHGPIVRLGPNLLDLNIPELIKTIYGTDGKWIKSDFYKNNSIVVNGNIVYHVFSETDQVQHARLKRPIVRHYSVSSVLETEPIMNTVITDFCGHLEKRFIEQNKECSFQTEADQAPDAWDFVSAVTFSKRFGYMDKGCDFDGTQQMAEKSIDYLGYCGQMPWLDSYLDKNPIMHLGPLNLGNPTRIAAESLFPRLEGKDANYDAKKPDFLQFFIESMKSHPDVVDTTTLMGYLLINLIAGADTTAITMKALFCYCLRDQRVWKRLNEDILAANIGTSQPASYSAARSIPYLEAVAREAMRLHPVVSHCMERIVPKKGLILPDGRAVPAGTLVGMNPYIVGRNKGVFGEDADEFIPDRWLQQIGESDEKYQLRMRLWNATDLTFGGGSRICLGRNLSMMELYKVVATLIARYEIQLIDPAEKWHTVSRWFYHIHGGLTCRLKKRDDMTGNIHLSNI